MLRTLRYLAVALPLAAAVPATAHANGTTSFNGYTICGGNAFILCASVHVTFGVTSGGQKVVTMKVQNLSGAAGNGSYAYGVFTRIGIDHLTPGIASVSLISKNTGLYHGNGTKIEADDDCAGGCWEEVANENPNGGGNLEIDMLSRTKNGIHGGIASVCAHQIYTQADLYETGCSPGGSYFQLQFSYTTTGGGFANTNVGSLYFKAQDGGMSGLSSECIEGTNCSVVPWTATPEPSTLILLGSGIFGLGGADVLRRRRRRAIAPPE